MKLGFSLQLWVMHGNNYDVIHKWMDELALIGYDGIELAYPFVMELYQDKPDELRRLLEMHGLEVATTYVNVDFRSPETVAEGEREAKEKIDFYSQIGCKNFLLDSKCEKPMYTPSLGYKFQYTDDQLAKAAEMTNRVAKYAAEKGMRLSWHTHWATFFEVPELFSKFWAGTDPSLVSLCPDVGQCVLVGRDPVEFVKQNIDRITNCVHFKDVVMRPKRRELWPGMVVPDNDGAYCVDGLGRWIETGRGDVDFPPIAQALKDAGFNGWINVDLDTSSYLARASAQACKDYINKALGMIGERDLKK